MKEATARIKINRLLETAGWRFFDDAHSAANIRLESGATIKQADLDALGNDFERTSKGFIDFLLLDSHGFPLIVLEAKAEDKNPLVGKEQARRYARAQNCRFVILSNGNLHYFWDLERGNPYVITSFPSPDSVTGYSKVQPNPQQLVDTRIEADYIVLTQRPGYQSEAGWKNEAERPAYIQTNKLRFLRPYQLKAVHHLQRAVHEGKDRFLFEMATGTGKTLTAAAVVEDSTRDFVLKKLAQKLKGLPLEGFVVHLLQCMGYHARQTRRNEPSVDVIAHRDHLGVEPPIIKVQVKSSPDTVTDKDVSALYGKLSTSEYGLFVTLGTFSPASRNFEQGKANLRLIDGDELVQLIFDHYEQFDSRHKGLLPLRRIYVPQVLDVD